MPQETRVESPRPSVEAKPVEGLTMGQYQSLDDAEEIDGSTTASAAEAFVPVPFNPEEAE